MISNSIKKASKLLTINNLNASESGHDRNTPIKTVDKIKALKYSQNIVKSGKNQGKITILDSLITY